MIENVAIEKYFHLGYDYKTITDLLLVDHGITMSVRTLKRRLKSNNLGKKKINVDEDLVRNIIRSEMQGPGHLAGYRTMWHILRIKHHVHTPRSVHVHHTAKLDKAFMTNTYISCRQNHSSVYFEGLAVDHFVK